MQDKEFEQEVFEYLDMLRESDITNTYWSIPYLCQEFDINVVEGKRLLLKWMETFEERHKVK